MKYTPELTKRITEEYVGTAGGATHSPIAPKTVAEIAAGLQADYPEEVIPERSIIAKLSSIGVYKKKEYLTKRGEVPIKKGEYIERIAVLLDVNAEMLESLEKVNKSVLALLATRLDYTREETTE